MTETELRAVVAAGGQVVVPPGTYTLTDTLVFTNAVARVVFPGDAACRLLWQGPPDKPAVWIDKGVWRREFVGGVLIDQGGTPGTGIGMRMCQKDRPAAYVGTVCGGNRLSGFVFNRFDTGLLLGDRDAATNSGYTATSENTFDGFKFYDCKTAVKLTDYNTLNNRLNGLGLVRCEFGVYCTQGGGMTHIDGGSASECGTAGTDYWAKAVFHFGSGGRFSVSRFRQGEGGTAKFLSVSGQGSVVSVYDCEISGTSPMAAITGVGTKKVPIIITYNGQLAVHGGLLDGLVMASGLCGGVSLYDVETTPQGVPRVVQRVNQHLKPASAGFQWRVSERGCFSYDGGDRLVRYADYVETEVDAA